tara:strand:+ start:5910 stop:6824 length:915 start_codon:yes stop_codon:yes gene_type:complete
LALRKPVDSEIREETLNSVQRFAVRYGHIQDPYLVQLNDALESGRNLANISILSPAKYLPTRSKAKPSSKLGIARLIAGVRNVLIFVPVALTWAAVGEATIAFNEFVQRNSGTPANFLQFWQDGYGVLDPFWSIGNIATVDFYLVSVIIVMTGFVASLQAVGQREKNQLFAQFEIDRRELAMRIEFSRYAMRPGTAQELPGDISAALRELRTSLARAQSGKEMAAAAKQLERQIQSANLAISKMQGFAVSLERSAKAVTAALTQITKTAQHSAKQSATNAVTLGKAAKQLELEAAKMKPRTPRQ